MTVTMTTYDCDRKIRYNFGPCIFVYIGLPIAMICLCFELEVLICKYKSADTCRYVPKIEVRIC